MITSESTFLRTDSYYIYVERKTNDVETPPIHSYPPPIKQTKGTNIAAERDAFRYKQYGLDHYSIPFVCIIWYNAQKNVFSIRVHDYTHVLKDRYEREVSDKTAGLPYTWNQVLDDYLDQIRNKLDSVLFAMKEKERIRVIVRERKMRDEAVVNIVRRCGSDWMVMNREEFSVQGTSQHSRPQSVLHALPQESRDLRVFPDYGRAKHRDSGSRHPIAAFLQLDSAQHFLQYLPKTSHQAPLLHSGQL